MQTQDLPEYLASPLNLAAEKLEYQTDIIEELEELMGTKIADKENLKPDEKAAEQL